MFSTNLTKDDSSKTMTKARSTLDIHSNDLMDDSKKTSKAVSTKDFGVRFAEDLNEKPVDASSKHNSSGRSSSIRIFGMRRNSIAESTPIRRPSPPPLIHSPSNTRTGPLHSILKNSPSNLDLQAAQLASNDLDDLDDATNSKSTHSSSAPTTPDNNRRHKSSQSLNNIPPISVIEVDNPINHSSTNNSSHPPHNSQTSEDTTKKTDIELLKPSNSSFTIDLSSVSSSAASSPTSPKRISNTKDDTSSNASTNVNNGTTEYLQDTLPKRNNLASPRHSQPSSDIVSPTSSSPSTAPDVTPPLKSTSSPSSLNKSALVLDTDDTESVSLRDNVSHDRTKRLSARIPKLGILPSVETMFLMSRGISSDALTDGMKLSAPINNTEASALDHARQVEAIAEADRQEVYEVESVSGSDSSSDDEEQSDNSSDDEEMITSRIKTDNPAIQPIASSTTIPTRVDSQQSTESIQENARSVADRIASEIKTISPQIPRLTSRTSTSTQPSNKPDHSLRLTPAETPEDTTTSSPNVTATSTSKPASTNVPPLNLGYVLSTI